MKQINALSNDHWYSLDHSKSSCYHCHNKGTHQKSDLLKVFFIQDDHHHENLLVCRSMSLFHHLISNLVNTSASFYNAVQGISAGTPWTIFNNESLFVLAIKQPKRTHSSQPLNGLNSHEHPRDLFVLPITIALVVKEPNSSNSLVHPMDQRGCIDSHGWSQFIVEADPSSKTIESFDFPSEGLTELDCLSQTVMI